ncbi:MAG: hypothetical protein ACP5J3_03305 [Pyrobaculum sp.]
MASIFVVIISALLMAPFALANAVGADHIYVDARVEVYVYDKNSGVRVAEVPVDGVVQSYAVAGDVFFAVTVPYYTDGTRWVKRGRYALWKIGPGGVERAVDLPSFAYAHVGADCRSVAVLLIHEGNATLLLYTHEFRLLLSTELEPVEGAQLVGSGCGLWLAVLREGRTVLYHVGDGGLEKIFDLDLPAYVMPDMRGGVYVITQRHTYHVAAGQVLRVGEGYDKPIVKHLVVREGYYLVSDGGVVAYFKPGGEMVEIYGAGLFSWAMSDGEYIYVPNGPRGFVKYRYVPNGTLTVRVLGEVPHVIEVEGAGLSAEGVLGPVRVFAQRYTVKVEHCGGSREVVVEVKDGGEETVAIRLTGVRIRVEVLDFFRRTSGYLSTAAYGRATCASVLSDKGVAEVVVPGGGEYSLVVAYYISEGGAGYVLEKVRRLRYTVKTSDDGSVLVEPGRNIIRGYEESPGMYFAWGRGEVTIQIYKDGVTYLEVIMAGALAALYMSWRHVKKRLGGYTQTRR